MPEISETAISQIQSGLLRLSTMELRISDLESSVPSNATNQAQQPLLGKPTADLEQGQSGEFEIYSAANDAKGNELATGLFLETVYNRAFDVTTDDLCYLLYVDGGWEASKAVC